jgi:hypothetical protein
MQGNGVLKNCIGMNGGCAGIGGAREMAEPLFPYQEVGASLGEEKSGWVGGSGVTCVLREHAMRQPDRFERMAQKADLFVADIDEAAALLRCYHRAVVRVVKRQLRYGHGIGEDLVIDSTGPFIEIKDFLAALDRLKKGT